MRIIPQPEMVHKFLHNPADNANATVLRRPENSGNQRPIFAEKVGKTVHRPSWGRVRTADLPEIFVKNRQIFGSIFLPGREIMGLP